MQMRVKDRLMRIGSLSSCCASAEESSGCFTGSAGEAFSFTVLVQAWYALVARLTHWWASRHAPAGIFCFAAAISSRIDHE